MGGAGGGAPAEKCAPRRFDSATGDPVVPCGLVAASNFNDTFAAALVPAGGGAATPLAIDESNIAWSHDASKLYGPVAPSHVNDDPATRTGGAATGPLNQDQHLMVWLRPAARPTLRKLWGSIDTPLPAGSTVRVTVLNRYNTYGFGGLKAVVLSTDSWAGGKNTFLGAAFLAAASASALAAAFFAAAGAGAFGGCLRARKFGDPADLSWNRKRA